jgi:DNA helicase-2/ATP-dependent DNA helicase PcrA
MSGDSEREIEEERRLMYVAMTRARKYLTLLFATTRFKYGSVDFCTPSRFLKDIDSRYLNMPSEGIKSSWNSRPSMFADEDSKPVFQRREYSSVSTFQAKKKLENEQPVRKPWQQGKFQKVTESMLENTAPGQSSALKVGSVIEHERFGIGSVLEVEGSGGDTKARIKFLNVGEKTLLLKFARYKILK